MTKSKYVADQEQKKTQKTVGLAGYSYLLVLFSLCLDGLAMLTGEVIWLFVGSLFLMFAWWITMSAAQRLARILREG